MAEKELHMNIQIFFVYVTETMQRSNFTMHQGKRSREERIPPNTISICSRRTNDQKEIKRCRKKNRMEGDLGMEHIKNELPDTINLRCTTISHEPRSMEGDTCKCGKKGTIKLILSNFNLTLNRYTWRHNEVLNVLFQEATA